MRNLLAGIALGVALVLAAALLFLTQGGMPVATRGGPLPLERFLASRALHHAMGRDARRPAPIPADGPNLVAGAKVYSANCQVCHGAPGEAQPSPIARGMFPRPPSLLAPGHGVADDPVGETYWKVKHGIRLTGMPGFEETLSEEELWQVSLLLREAEHLPGPVRAALR
ncbi:c-type cytochrome [Anaeromyxobacter diazotrophicus]|uniref:Cytochrome c domain-containing protein n=1 Tax=Anaeromyxobacter diazotrophicus TaxID=2590199 RepID=A0A7I9VH38_9BACT|nr:cytochrome c [Anaeromyxobacter diazotrophicus]GEJ55458.1 hypothetical protein AMYX_01990 [Anaeromyxobacter diazotrophicus]